MAQGGQHPEPQCPRFAPVQAWWAVADTWSLSGLCDTLCHPSLQTSAPQPPNTHTAQCQGADISRPPDRTAPSHNLTQQAPPWPRCWVRPPPARPRGAATPHMHASTPCVSLVGSQDPLTPSPGRVRGHSQAGPGGPRWPGPASPDVCLLVCLSPHPFLAKAFKCVFLWGSRNIKDALWKTHFAPINLRR